MLLSDYILLAALLFFLFVWWRRGIGRRRLLLGLAVAMTLAAGAYGLIVDRWQVGAGVAVGLLLLSVLVVNRLRNAPTKTGLPWLSGSLFTVLGAFAFLAIWFFPIRDLPSPSGDHAVGVRDFELVDKSRPGVFSAAADEPRRLLVRVWYPAEKTNGKARAYFEASEVDTTAAALGRNLARMPFFFKYLRHVRTNSFEGAKLEAGAENLPVVFFSHGYTVFLGQNTVLMEELASHGYVVYSISHTFDASDAVMPNGDVLATDPRLQELEEQSIEEGDEDLDNSLNTLFGKPMARYAAVIRAKTKDQSSETRFTKSADVWLADRLFVHDSLARGAAPESVAKIVAASKFSKVGEMGMSFGGSTTGAICMVDRRCAAGINLDGGEFHYTPLGKNEPVPFMMFYSDFVEWARQTAEEARIDLPKEEAHGFNDFSYERPEVAGMRRDIYRLKVTGARHIGVSDFSLFVRRPIRDALFGSTPSDKMLSIQKDFVLGFFDKHLRGMANSFPQDAYEAHVAWVARDDVSDVREGWLAAHPEDSTVEVTLETDLGEIELSLYPERAPISVANFLAHVDEGLFDGASFYSVTKTGGSSAFGLVQGGVLGGAIATGSKETLGKAVSPLPPIDHETTSMTGIINERGVVSFGRFEPGTASSEFVINIDDNPVLDTGGHTEPGDGAGYATFGRVLRGMRILEGVQEMPADAQSQIPFLAGQILNNPVIIRRASRSVRPLGPEE